MYTIAYTEGKGEGIVYTNPEETMCEEGANLLDDRRMNAVAIQPDAKIAAVYRIKSSGEVKDSPIVGKPTCH